jgi:hypothetical protein
VPGEDRRPPSWLPWVLFCISLALLFIGLGLRIAFPEGADDGAFYAVSSTLGMTTVPLVGALLAARLPTNPYGWLWSAGGLSFAVLAVNDGLMRTDAAPGWLTGLLVDVSYRAGIGVLVFVLLLFPTGRLPSPAWRWPARVAVLVTGAGLLVLPFASPGPGGNAAGPWAVEGRAGDVLGALLDGGVVVVLLLIVAAAVSVLVRFRRAGPVERQQLKWFLLAAGLAAGTTGLDVVGVPLSEPAWAVVDAITMPALPAAVAIAVLRYRLYEIDRLISRSVSYVLLTGGLVALYLVVVALLRPLLEPLTGSSALAVAGSTLAVAAVFNPARRRLQAVVDRRFDRARYDAARAVDAFAARLREQVDLDEVTTGLRETVVATVAPTRVAVWLRAPSGTGGP